jgi:hypothetical protein
MKSSDAIAAVNLQLLPEEIAQHLGPYRPDPVEGLGRAASPGMRG